MHRRHRAIEFRKFLNRIDSQVVFHALSHEHIRSIVDLMLTGMEKQLEEMFTRHGFTTGFETASFAENTRALRGRIESGEVRGPRILTAGYA